MGFVRRVCPDDPRTRFGDRYPIVGHGKMVWILSGDSMAGDTVKEEVQVLTVTGSTLEDAEG